MGVHFLWEASLSLDSQRAVILIMSKNHVFLSNLFILQMKKLRSKDITSSSTQTTSPRSHSLSTDKALKDDTRNEKGKSYHFTGLHVLGSDTVCGLRACTRDS